MPVNTEVVSQSVEVCDIHGAFMMPLFWQDQEPVDGNMIEM